MTKNAHRNDLLLTLAGLLLYGPAVGRYGLKLEVLLVLSLLLGYTVERIAAALTNRRLETIGWPAWVLLPLVLPPALPLWLSAASILFAAITAVAFFGGYGRHPVAPIAVGWAFARLSFAATFGFAWSLPFPRATTGFYTWSANFPTVDHPLTYLAGRTDWTLGEAVLGAVPSSPASACPLLVLLLGLVLLALRAGSARTCVGFLGAFLVLTLLFPAQSAMPFPHVFFTGDLLFASFFVLSDPRVCARTWNGRWLAGVLGGAAAFLIRHYAAFPDGVFFAVLLANVFTPILDEAVLGLRRREARAA